MLGKYEHTKGIVLIIYSDIIDKGSLQFQKCKKAKRRGNQCFGKKSLKTKNAKNWLKKFNFFNQHVGYVLYDGHKRVWVRKVKVQTNS